MGEETVKPEERVQKIMDSMAEDINKKLDEQVASGEIDEHEARDRYFKLMMITTLVFRP